MDPTVDEVRSALVSTLKIEDRADAIDASTPLFGALPELDSMSVIELVCVLEERFDIEMNDEEIIGEVFETVGSLAAFVDTKRTSNPDPQVAGG
jgi:acyl carrier protein